MTRARTSTNRRSNRPMLQCDSIASASPLKRSEAMFDSVKNWLNRNDQHQADKQKLEAEAKDFRLPGEMMPQVFKCLFFAGLGVLNYRLFSHAVPGLWGQSTGVVAVMAEAIALYATHDAPEEPRVSSIAPPQPQPDAETSAAEVSMTGIDGARILSFPAPVFGRQSNVD